MRTNKRTIINIMGVYLPKYSFIDLNKKIKICLKENEKIILSKAPAEFLVRAQKNPEFKKVLKKSNLVVPDGIGVLWAAKYLSLKLPNIKFQILKILIAIWQMIYSGAALVFNPNYAKGVLPERLSGIEVLYTMLEACQEAKKSVFFFGAKPEVIEKAVKIIKEKYPKLKIAGFYHGYGDKSKGIIEKINKSRASLLIVALGSPEQEYWIRDNYKYLKHVRVAVGEGGSFDAITGATKRAPVLIQRIGLEWLWRGVFAPNLTNNAPHRLKRIWNAVPVFIYEVVKYKIRTSNSK